MRCEVICLSPEVRSEGCEIIVFKPYGSLCTLNAVNFGQKLREACTGRYPYLLVDMAEVKVLDGCGVSALLKALRVARQHSVKLVLVALQHNVRWVVELVGLTRSFEIYADPQQFMDTLLPAQAQLTR